MEAMREILLDVAILPQVRESNHHARGKLTTKRLVWEKMLENREIETTGDTSCACRRRVGGGWSIPSLPK